MAGAGLARRGLRAAGHQFESAGRDDGRLLLITQASNDNIPLIDFGVTPPGDVTDPSWSAPRRFGITPGSAFVSAEQVRLAYGFLFVVDDKKAPDIELLEAAKAAGTKIAFNSGDTPVNEAQLKRRLQAITAAGLDWKDFWVPGKP